MPDYRPIHVRILDLVRDAGCILNGIPGERAGEAHARIQEASKLLFPLACLEVPTESQEGPEGMEDIA